MASLGERLKRSWNAFMNRAPTEVVYRDIGYGSSIRPDRFRLTRGNERSIVTAVYNRMALDTSSVKFVHVKNDEYGQFKSIVKSKLNNCLTIGANIDQVPLAFFVDVCMSMFDEGTVAIVPMHTTVDPNKTDGYDIWDMRTGKIVEWYPQHVKIQAYSEEAGKKIEGIKPKSQVAIIENPYYSVMNEPNSTLQRLIRTLNSIDRINDQQSSGKLDLIIQTPGSIKSQKLHERAENRRKEIEAQLIGSKYGIAYADGTEKIIQLNRPIENNLWEQASDLTTQLFNQLGLTQAILDGTADEKTMANYYSRTIDPILDVITKEMTRKFLSPTAITQGQAINYFRNALKLVSATDLAEASDKFSRNAILSSNEIRSEMGYYPVDDERANELSNKNMPQEDREPNPVTNPETNQNDTNE